MTKRDPEVERYAAWGYASAIPGLQLAVDTLQHQLDAIRRRLGQLQEPKPQRGRPPKQNRSGWSDDPEERRREMARRRAKRKQNLHPRDPEHPRHAEWAAKTAKAAKKYWASLSPAEKQIKQVAMQRGRKHQAVEVRASA